MLWEVLGEGFVREAEKRKSLCARDNCGQIATCTPFDTVLTFK